MFIAKVNGNIVSAGPDWYAQTTFDWSNPKWPSEKDTRQLKKIKNFADTVVEPPTTPYAKLICVGRNYVAHAKELGNEVPKEPLLFLKPPSAVIGNHGKVILPKESQQVEHEVELVVVIGKRGKMIPERKTADYVLGYTIGLDITARDLQKKDSTWFRGKGYDTFAPIGPWIAGDVNLDNCHISLSVNGEVRQSGNTSDMIFKVPFLLSYISQIVTLEPGDLVFTGTPEGVGKISAGDTIVAQIDQIGTLKVSVAPAA